LGGLSQVLAETVILLVEEAQEEVVYEFPKEIATPVNLTLVCPGRKSQPLRPPAFTNGEVQALNGLHCWTPWDRLRGVDYIEYKLLKALAIVALAFLAGLLGFIRPQGGARRGKHRD
jgi:hypothetical protein